VLVVVRGIGRDCVLLGMEMMVFEVDIFWALLVGSVICRTVGAVVTELVGTLI